MESGVLEGDLQQGKVTSIFFFFLTAAGPSLP